MVRRGQGHLVAARQGTDALGEAVAAGNRLAVDLEGQIYHRENGSRAGGPASAPILQAGDSERSPRERPETSGRASVPPGFRPGDSACDPGGVTRSGSAESRGRGIRRAALVHAGALALIALLAYIDWWTGEEIALSIFYLVPVALASWFVADATAWGIVLAAGAGMLWADLATGHAASHPAIPYWNALVRTGFFAFAHVTVSRIRAANRREALAARSDPLTGLPNRRAFDERLVLERDRSRRFGRPFALALIDLDGFKAVNDDAGHEAGDRLLREVATALSSCLRDVDVVARVGGDEFAVLLPETNEAETSLILERVRIAVEAAPRGREWRVSLSAGAVVFAIAPHEVSAALRLADALMYEAKADGKNRVRVRVHQTAGSPEVGVEPRDA
jgi:diguanylate cyclase (GGDEF)-like protein